MDFRNYLSQRVKGEAPGWGPISQRISAKSRRCSLKHTFEIVSRIKQIILLILLLVFGTGTSIASYYLCIGTFDQDEAETLHRQLADKGYPVYVLYGETYEVRLGSYETREKADEAVEKLRSEEKIVARVIEEEEIDQYQFTWDGENTDKAVDQGTFQNYSDPRAQKIVSLGLDLFGHPYKYGGTRIGKGIDCSFFVQTIFKELGIHLPRTSGEQFKMGAAVDKAELKVGDLVFFKKTYYSRKKKGRRGKGVTRINHVGIYIGNGEFIHATLNVKRVTISRLDENYFTIRFAGARRVLTQ
jgi:cell wall-associated NlpC family hydrolase